jgi:hypothetical protein
LEYELVIKGNIAVPFNYVLVTIDLNVPTGMSIAWSAYAAVLAGSHGAGIEDDECEMGYQIWSIKMRG